MGELRDRMEEEMRLRGMSQKTVDTYLGIVGRFARFHGRSPGRLGAEEVRAYLLHLIEERKLSGSTVNQALCALRFFYLDVLGQAFEVGRLPFQKRKHKLPVVLTEAEMARLLRAPMSLKLRTVLMTLYSAGLRLGEGLRLCTTDIDSGAMSIRIRQGKGGRDRVVILSPYLLGLLRRYWRVYRPESLLFYGATKDKPIHPATIQKAVRKAAQAAGIRKRVSPHTLRHSCATHLLESGTSLRYIQELLGHRSLRTTQIYTQVVPGRVTGLLSPLDRLGLEAPPHSD